MLPSISKTIQSFFKPVQPEPVKKASWLLITYLLISMLAFLTFLVGSFCALFFPCCISVALISLATLLSLCAFSPCVGYYVCRASVQNQAHPKTTAQSSPRLKKSTQNDAYHKSLQKTPPASPSSKRSFFSLLPIKASSQAYEETESTYQSSEDEETDLSSPSITPQTIQL